MKTAWIFCDEGKIGSLSQAKALANGLGLDYKIYILKKNIWHKFLPAELGFFNINFFPQLVKKPYPDIVIGIGSLALIPVLYLRKVCKTIFIQKPRVSPRYFDYVIAPQHDRIKGDNVIETIGSLNEISPQKIKKMTSQRFEKKPRSIVVFIGGHSQHSTYTDDMVINLCKKLLILHQKGYVLYISPSRRTPKKYLDIIHMIMNNKAEYIWNLKDENPYMDFLAIADKFIVTSDSISMMSELCSTGKPTYIYDVGITKEKFQMFIKTLVMQGYAKMLDDDFVSYKPNVLNQLPNCVEIMKQKLDL